MNKNPKYKINDVFIVGDHQMFICGAWCDELDDNWYYILKDTIYVIVTRESSDRFEILREKDIDNLKKLN